MTLIEFVQDALVIVFAVATNLLIVGVATAAYLGDWWNTIPQFFDAWCKGYAVFDDEDGITVKDERGHWHRYQMDKKLSQDIRWLFKHPKSNASKNDSGMRKPDQH